MKILYINWSPLQRGAELGGGVNIYTQSIALAMTKKGHEVYSLISGLTYNFAGGIYTKRTDDYKNIINFEIINTPNMAPGFFNFDSPTQDISEPLIEEQFSQFLNNLKPDVIHFNNIEGFSAGCIKIAKSSGARVIYSLHNYHPVCNQIGFLYKNREVCHDFLNGTRCLNCITPPPKKSEIKVRKLRYLADNFMEGELLLNAAKYIHTKLQTIRLGLKSIRVIQKNRKERKESIENPIESLSHKITKQDQRDIELAGLPYKERRAGMVDGINHADCVLAVSDWVSQVYSRMGVDESRLHTCHIGSAIADIAVKNPYSPAEKDLNKPLNFVYLGISDPHKGLPFVLDALNQMHSNTLSKIHLHLYARGHGQLRESLDQISDKIGRLVLHDGYNYSAIPKILTNMDIGIVPPIWWDNAPQVVFEMLAMKVPVLGAKIGGIPDFVRHMENGLLFKPENEADLIEKITTVVTNPQLIDQFRAAITPMKTTDQHADELEVFYQKDIE